MPYRLKKIGSGWYVIGPDGERKNAKPYPSREAAMPYFKKLWSTVKKEKK